MAAHLKTALATKRASAAINILRRRQLESKIGLSRSAIYARLDPDSPQFDATFPRPVSLGAGKTSPVGWYEHEIDNWLNGLATTHRTE
jgi:prophage regulatory protein